MSLLASDLLRFHESLPPDLRARLQTLRSTLEAEIAPGVDAAWLEGRTPSGWSESFARIADDVLFPGGFTWPPPSPLFAGLVKYELGRVDASVATFYGVQIGLAAASIEVFGSEAQRRRWVGPLTRFESIGSFSLSEPEVGSDAARGVKCTARPDGDGWSLTGTKKWSGNAPIADVHVVFAKVEGETGLAGFLIERDAPGMHIERIETKIAKRAVENAVVTLDSCRVPRDARLPGVNSFKDVARALSIGRFVVAFEATGLAAGAFERARAYALEREQFGRPIASFQLVQDKLVRMAAEVAACQALCFRMADLAEGREPDPALASLGKVVCAGGMRRVVALARETLGGNGILLEHGIARHFADAEAVYSYEGTQDINTLIAGRALTGIGAFT
ncbi:MAG: acyl-CoA dehydrogenase family protein [Planctomycetota bacterium]